MIRYMLDTDICSYIMREKPRHVLEKFKTLSMDQIFISAITYAEFMFGVEASVSREKHRRIVEQFVLHVDVIPWDRPAGDHYGQIRVALQARGSIIGAMDMMIAAHARSKSMVLVTNNEKHFKRVPGLTIENWT